VCNKSSKGQRTKHTHIDTDTDTQTHRYRQKTMVNAYVSSLKPRRSFSTEERDSRAGNEVNKFPVTRTLLSAFTSASDLGRSLSRLCSSPLRERERERERERKKEKEREREREQKER
jgi:hypothetical protein